MLLESLAPHSRVWIFQADRILTKDESEKVISQMTQFIPQWASHGKDLYGQFELVDNLFLLVGVDERRSPTSGCSLDTLNREVKKLGQDLGVEFFDRLRVAYVDEGGKITLVPLAEFKNRLKRDEVRQSTLVFNNLIETKADLDTKWKCAVKDSWHKNLLDIL